MQLSGQNETCPALLTVPANYLEEGSVKSVGVVLGHGTDADDQRGPFLSGLSMHLAKQGHVVMRFYCKQKEQRRQRIFERSADTAATSPYARAVTKWVFIGHENGARIAALVGYKNPRPKRGFIFLSYPLMDPAPPPPKQKAGAEPPADSTGPLLKLVETVKAPILFICGELDYNCPGADLKAVGPQLAAPGVDARAVILPNLDANFKAPNAAQVAPEIQSQILSFVDTFLQGIATDSFASLDFPKLDEIVPSNRVPARPVTAAPEAEEEEGEGDGDDNDVDMDAEPAPSGVVPASGAQQFPSAAAAFNAAQQAAMVQQQRMAVAAAMGPAAQQAQQFQALQMAMLQQQMAAAAGAMGVGQGFTLPTQHQLQPQHPPPQQQPPQ